MKMDTSDLTPCRPQDFGKFEMTHRDGCARLGKLHTKHGILRTPTLLPVVNPNILTVKPRRMLEDFGYQALITNSYVIWKHDELRKRAMEEGVHSLLDFPGVIMTDSGTFQSYVYGDVEVKVDEIVRFQREIGVDIGTMLDVFGRPDMSREEISSAVQLTADRAEDSLREAGGEILLNGPIQGGLHEDLRAQSANMMSNTTHLGRGFSVHPIGGIVPLMESQRYSDLFTIILASSSELPSSRPMHIFGCGHPMLFPMCIALGADLFDSAAYALFAKDGRILSEEGTHRIDTLVEWPTHSRQISNLTPNDVREMEKSDRTALLAKHNLEVTQRELARCREAVRNGSIWVLAERRSHSSPYLRAAFEKVSESMKLEDSSPISSRINTIVMATNPVRPSSEPFSSDIYNRPHIRHARLLMEQRWRMPGSWSDGSSGPPKEIAILQGGNPPWRISHGQVVQNILSLEPRTIIFVDTPMGLLPYSLEDLSPWCRVEGGEDIEFMKSEEKTILRSLKKIGLQGINVSYYGPSNTDYEKNQRIRSWIERCSLVDKLSILCGVNPLDGCVLTEGTDTRHSNTGRPVNVFKDGKHLFSPRLNDGGISLALEGAKALHSLRSKHVGKSKKSQSQRNNTDHPGVPSVTLHSDAVPFVGAGRNVMHGFIEHADSWLTVGQPCIVMDLEGNFVAHGTSNSTSEEMAVLKKGVAVRIREGILEKK